MSTPPVEKTLLDLIAGAGDHPALLAPGRPALSYTQLRANVIELAGQLNSFGLGRGDRIAIAMGNGPEVILTFFAAALCGTAAPLNPKYKQDEFAFYYEDIHAKALIRLPDSMPLALAAATPDMAIVSARPRADGTLAFSCEHSLGASRPAELAQPDDVAMILHTSGTTSRPKRVPIRHRNLAASARHIRQTLGLTADDRCMNIMPLFHIHGLIAAVLASLAAGGCTFCTPGFNALRFFAWLDEAKPSWYTA
ncbi:MAG TPA: AMP-binding protein, partial [Roseiflexaceae bacterium]|nr:AMP-binding protein [Roseiflexaceae bacterium]